MTYELWTLVAMGFYLMLLAYVPGIAKIQANHIIANRNFNRDDMQPLSGKGARAERALANLYENLPAFAILVLAIHVTDAYNQMTMVGASLFLGARILHPILYILGRPFLRSTSYAVGTAGLIMMALQLT